MVSFKGNKDLAVPSVKKVLSRLSVSIFFGGSGDSVQPQLQGNGGVLTPTRAQSSSLIRRGRW
jgi:hypothetical protein